MWDTSRIDRFARRMLDIAGAVVGLVLLAPLLALIALAIKLHDGGPIYYRALRVGKDGHLFRLYKFRTMIVDADRIGPAVTISGDGRVTPIGRWLRRTKLDEMPQLLNVLRGEMSLVGPRPEDPRYVQLYTPSQRGVLAVCPGITSPASLRYRHEEQLLDGPDWQQIYIGHVLPAKLAIDMEYLARRTVWTDLRLMWATCWALFT